MNEMEKLWNEAGHLFLPVPDTIVIEEKEIKEWIYTSHVCFT